MDASPPPTQSCPPFRLSPELSARLRLLYEQLDQAIASHQPRCALSGRCCKFKEYGHTLFLSAIEAAYLLEHAPPPARPLDQGDSCPWQDLAGRCTARDARPLGCRFYFCDPDYEPASGPLSEQFLNLLKRLCDETSSPWAYAPLHHHLMLARQDGRFLDP